LRRRKQVLFGGSDQAIDPDRILLELVIDQLIARGAAELEGASILCINAQRGRCVTEG
jgi:hypothetical protein